jgi:membrane-associated protease RseP (regulator of RpoE activity)
LGASQALSPSPFREESWPPPARPRTRLGRHALLLLLTALSVFFSQGARFLETPRGLVFSLDVSSGLLFTASLMGILLAHEMGHYVACRAYGVDATLPYFIPFPLSPAGTLGAFIRIRGRIPHRRALFDIGAAGPFAGFLVCLPVLVLGVLEGRFLPREGPEEGPGFLGEPLLFRFALALLRGPVPEGTSFVIGPLGFAAWFGLLVTALNLMPVGQLDGGHMTYALSPRGARIVSRLGLATCLGLLYFRPFWVLWTLLLLVLGRRPHPPTSHDQPGLDPPRVTAAALGYAVFVLSFTPSPVLVSWSYLAAGFSS